MSSIILNKFHLSSEITQCPLGNSNLQQLWLRKCRGSSSRELSLLINSWVTYWRLLWNRAWFDNLQFMKLRLGSISEGLQVQVLIIYPLRQDLLEVQSKS